MAKKEIISVLSVIILVSLIFSMSFVSANIVGDITGNVVEAGKITGNAITDFTDFFKNLFGIQSVPITATRSFNPMSYTAGSGVNVTLSFVLDASLTTYNFDEILPPFWSASLVSDPNCAIFPADVNSRVTLRCGAFFGPLGGGPSTKTITYIATPPVGTTGTQTFSSDLAYDDGSVPGTIGGSLSINQLISTYSVSVTKAGAGSGTVTSSPSGIDCGSACSASFNSGISVTLNAVPAAGSTFAGWSNGCIGTGACIVSAAGSRTATFNLIPFDYSLSAPGITVTQGSSATQTVTVTKTTDAAGQLVTVAIGALPLGVSLISPNSQSCNPNAGSCTVSFTYSADTSALTGPYSTGVTGTSAGLANKIASFTLTVSPLPTYTLNVVKSPAAGGTVTGSNINCGTACSASYPQGTVVALTAAPAAGYTFGSWSGACTGATCSVTMNSSQTVTANFNAIAFDYSLSAPGVTITAGTNNIQQTVTVTKTTQSLTANSVAVNVGSLPSGVSVGSSSQSCTPTAGSCTVTFSYSATAGATTGSASVTLTGASTGLANKAASFTMTVSPLPINVPATPTGLIAFAFSSNQINLWWNSVSGATSYKVYRGTNSGGETFLTSVGSNEFNNTGLSAGTYYYRVSAVNSAGESGLSNEVAVTISVSTNQGPRVNAGLDQAIVLPNSAILNGTVTDDGLPLGSTLAISWLKASGPGTVSFGNSSLAVTTATFSVSGIYTLRLIGNDGVYGISDDVIITVNNGSVTTYIVSVSKAGSGTVTSSPSGIDCGNTCSASFNSGISVTLNAVPAVGSTFAGWSNGCSGTGTCIVSATASRTATFSLVVPNVTIPTTPSGLSASSSASISQLYLAWNDNSNNEDGFNVERASKIKGNSNWVRIASLGSNVNYYNNTGLASGTTYYYRVNAFNSAGTSGYSNTDSASTCSFWKKVFLRC